MQQNLAQRLPNLLRKNSVLRTAAMFAIVGLFLLAGCGNASQQQQTGSQIKRGGTLNVGLIAEASTLDPEKSVTLYDADVMANMYDSLFMYDRNNQIQPELVSSYAYKTPTDLDLKLHTGITFADGTPLNADAVIFNINRFINDKASPRYTDVADITKLQKISDSELEIHLKNPFAPFLGVLTGDVGYVLSPKAVQALGKNLGNTPTNAGSGPFLFVEWIKGDHLTLKANPHYWRKDAQGNALPYLASIRYRTITNGSVMFTNLETGAINVATGIAPNDVASVKSNPSLIYKQVSSPGFGSLFLNLGVSPFNNIHVRRAIAWGINRQEIIDHVFAGLGTPALGPIAQVNWAYNKNINSFTFNQTKAKAELAQSGLSNVSFTLLTQSASPTALQEAQFIQSELKDVGITVNITQETFTQEVTDVQQFKYQSASIGWTGGLDPDNDVYLLFTSNGGFNYTKYSNPQVDKLLNEGRTTVDQAKRLPLYRQAEQLIVQDVPFIFINHPVVAQETTKNVQHYFLSPGGVLQFADVYMS